MAIAVGLTLGHLLGPQSDLLAISAHDHEIEQDHAETPAHEHETHACGLAMLPGIGADALDEGATDLLLPDCANFVAPVADTVDARDRSPTDLISELQVNRV